MTDPLQPDPTEPGPTESDPIAPGTPGPGAPAPEVPDPEAAAAAYMENLRRRPFPEATLTQIPIAAIDANALLRDRTRDDEPALLELRLSIARSGLRMPIEVFPLAAPYPPFTHGLISGFRRLAAFRGLHELTEQDKYATIPAFLRTTARGEELYLQMVEENAIRVEISPWERAMVAVKAARAEVYAGIDAAVDALYANLGRIRRTRIRAVAHLAAELDGYLLAPETLSERQLLRLAPLIPRNFGDLLRATLCETTDPASQWRAILPIIVEAERPDDLEPEPVQSGRPRRVLELATPRLTIRREMTRNGWSLHFSGAHATSMLLDDVFFEIERMFAPVPPRDPSPHKNLHRP